MKQKFRASSMGLLMTEPRTKSETLSETTKTHLLELFVESRYGRHEDISSKYIEKGLAVEEDSITLLSRVKKKFFKKNEERISNEFIIGTPDLYVGESIETAEHIYDIKSSWDIYTFFKNLYGGVNKMYYWQMQSYMALTGAKTATLAFCLVNTPEVMIEDEKRRLFYKMAVPTMENPEYLEACELLEQSMKFDDMPMAERVIQVDIERNESDIERMYERVKQCRQYLKDLTEHEHFNQDLLINILK